MASHALRSIPSSRFAEHPQWIESPQGRLFAIEHEPLERRERSDLVVFLNAGLQNRAGPQRIYVETAREMARLGLGCLRVDLPGIGDSSGRSPTFHYDVHDPADVHAIVDHVVSRKRLRVPDRIVLLGLCGGARVALKAAVQDDRVGAVIAWSLPIVSAPPDMPISSTARMSPEAARDQLKIWRGKLLSPASWAHYLGSRSGRAEGWQRVRSVLGGLPSETMRGHDELQAEFLRVLERFLGSPCPGFFAFGERDRIPIVEFEKRCGSVVRGEDPVHPVEIIAEGDHTFTNIAARRRLIELTCSWCLESLAER